MKDPAKWKLLKRKLICKTRFVKVYIDDVRLPDGKMINGWTVVEKPSYVKVVPIDKNGRVIIQREYRHAVDRYMWETCGGIIEKGDSPVATAKRELMEETGYGGGTFRFIGIMSDYGTTDMHTGYVVLAKGVSKKGKQHFDVGESISNIKAVPIAKLKKMIANGEFENSSAIAAITMSGILFK